MKTIDQLAKEYVQSRPYSTLDSPKLKEEAYDGFIEGIKYSEKWISIKEELPEKDKTGFYVPVLVIDENSGLCSSAAYKNERFIPDSPLLEHEDITHWRHIHLNNKK